jgi:hypothetical protein
VKIIETSMKWPKSLFFLFGQPFWCHLSKSEPRNMSVVFSYSEEVEVSAVELSCKFGVMSQC